jgi:hypothetical protein
MKRLSAIFSAPKTAFRVLSDLHLDHEAQYLTFHIPVSAPFLILAGNIGRLIDYDSYLSFLIRRCNLHEKVYLVPGALEFHGLNWMDGLQLAHRMEKEPATKGRLEVLYETRSDVPGTNVTLLGCTLWSHIRDADTAAVLRKVAEFDKETGIQGWSVEKHNAEHTRDLMWLRTELAPPAASAAAADGKALLVITAFAPDLRSALEPWDVDAPWSSAYGTNLLVEGAWDGVKMWSVGFVSNQRGRVGESVTGLLRDGLNEKQKVGVFDVMKVVKV